MTLLEAVKFVCKEAAPQWGFHFDDRQLMNVRADDVLFPLIFFEEYREGKYSARYFFEKSTRVELYFCKLCAMHNNGAERERLREEIETEAVKPFIEAFNSHPEIFSKVNEWNFYTPPPRFDAGEVSVMLRFDTVMTECSV